MIFKSLNFKYSIYQKIKFEHRINFFDIIWMLFRSYFDIIGSDILLYQHDIYYSGEFEVYLIEKI